MKQATRQDRNYPYYYQLDERWGNLQYANSDTTIKKRGCLISCVGMILGIGPGNLNKWLLENGGYSNNDFVWSSVSKLGKTYVGQVSLNEARAYFDKGNHVILKLQTYHFVLMTNYEVDAKNRITSVTVLDPGYKNVNTYDSDEISHAKIYK